jgi:hypothetical protein
MLRRILKAITLALVAAAPISVSAAAAGSNVAEVLTVQPTRVADLVLLHGGFDSGLRQGMVCRVTRGTTEIAEVLLVGLRPSCSAALIVNVAPNQSIRAGDVARIKVLKS